MIREITYFLNFFDSSSLIKAIMSWNFSVSVLTYIWKKKKPKTVKNIVMDRKIRYMEFDLSEIYFSSMCLGAVNIFVYIFH